ncbi:MAG: hypothetical protein N3D18_03350 [Roseococcus sp.]|nr:hypothetical protein [Roseococcus sp.]
MTEKPVPKDRAARALFAVAIVLGLVVPTGLLAAKLWIPSLDLGAAGDFLAGAFGPAALGVLAAGFLLQKQELTLQRHELEETRKELAGQKEEMKKATEESKIQTRILRLQYLQNEWNLTRERLHIELQILNGFFIHHGIQNERGLNYIEMTSKFHEFLCYISVERVNSIITNLSGAGIGYREAMQNYVDTLHEFEEKERLSFQENKNFESRRKESEIAEIFKRLLQEVMHVRGQ